MSGRREEGETSGQTGTVGVDAAANTLPLDEGESQSRSDTLALGVDAAANTLPLDEGESQSRSDTLALGVGLAAAVALLLELAMLAAYGVLSTRTVSVEVRAPAAEIAAIVSFVAAVAGAVLSNRGAAVVAVLASLLSWSVALPVLLAQAWSFTATGKGGAVAALWGLQGAFTLTALVLRSRTVSGVRPWLLLAVFAAAVTAVILRAR